MNIEGFLTQFIEDYLLRDLASMAAVTPPSGETGACGYSMVLVTLAGCELLGAISYTKPFDPRSGSEHFTHFWQKGLYPTDPVRSNLAPTIYKLVRHGLAHAFVTKPRILVTKNKGTKNHLCRDAAGVLTIDCLALAEDFQTAYERFVIPQVRNRSRPFCTSATTRSDAQPAQRRLGCARDTDRFCATSRLDGGATVHSVRPGNDQFTYPPSTLEAVVSATLEFIAPLAGNVEAPSPRIHFAASGRGYLKWQVTGISTGSGNNGASDFQFYKNNVSAVPEPASLTLLGVGILGLAAKYRKRKGVVSNV